MQSIVIVISYLGLCFHSFSGFFYEFVPASYSVPVSRVLHCVSNKYEVSTASRF